MSTLRAQDLRLGSQRIAEAIAAVHRAKGVETKDAAGDAAADSVIDVLVKGQELLDDLVVAAEGSSTG